MKIIPCYLDIQTWGGISIGAIHYYGSLKCDREQNYAKVELKHKLTQKEADALTTKDRVDSSCGYEKGYLSERFDTEKQIIRLALKTYKIHFPKANILIRGSATYAEPQPCLDGPKKIKNRINQLYKLAVKLGWWDGGNEARVDKICNEYYHDILGK